MCSSELWIDDTFENGFKIFMKGICIYTSMVITVKETDIGIICLKNLWLQVQNERNVKGLAVKELITLAYNIHNLKRSTALCRLYFC